MKRQTREFLALLLKSDETVCPELADKALRFLDRDREPQNDPTQIVLYEDVVRFLGLDRFTIEGYIQKGLLDRAYDPRRKLAVGVTRESYIRLTTRKPTGEPIGKRLNYASRLWSGRH